MSRPRENRRWRRWSAVLIGTALALCAVELCLQIGAYVIWRNSRSVPSPAARGAETTVLCVGDSYTFGLGTDNAETESYPAHLQDLVDAGDIAGVRVVKDAWPARNSREVLQRLPAQLERLRPTRVYVLVGANDIWRPPEPGAETQGFPRVWRTRRLARLLWRWACGQQPERPEQNIGEPIPSDAAPFVGNWRLDDFELTLLPNGVALCLPQALRWREADEPGMLVIWDPREPQRRLDVRWNRRGEDLVVAWPGSQEPKTLTRTALTRNQIEHGATMLRFWSGTGPPATAVEPAVHAPDSPDAVREIDAHAESMPPAELAALRAELALNLGRIAASCRQCGSTVVFLTYPCGMKGVRGVPEAAGREVDVSVIDLYAPMQQLLDEIPVHELFIRDGHCTSRGYQEVAEIVYEDLRRAIRGGEGR